MKGDANSSITSRIESGEALFNNYQQLSASKSAEAKEQLADDTKNWHDINLVALGRMFDTDEYVKKYEKDTTYYPPMIRVANNPSFPPMRRELFPGQRQYAPPSSPPPPQKPPPEAFIKAGLKNLRSILAVIPHIEEHLSTADTYISTRRKLGEMNLHEKDRVRFQFLKELHDATNGNTRKTANLLEIGTKLNLNEEETINVYDYLKNAGLLVPRTEEGGTSISHAGITEVEQAEKTPQKATEHFPPNITINGNVIGSALQVGNTNSTQTANINVNSQGIQELVTWLGELKKNIPNLSLSSQDAQAITRNVTALEDETQEAQPDKGILKTQLSRVHKLLETVGTEMVAQEMLKQLPVILHHLNLVL